MSKDMTPSIFRAKVDALADGIQLMMYAAPVEPHIRTLYISVEFWCTLDDDVDDAPNVRLAALNAVTVWPVRRQVCLPPRQEQADVQCDDHGQDLHPPHSPRREARARARARARPRARSRARPLSVGGPSRHFRVRAWHHGPAPRGPESSVQRRVTGSLHSLRSLRAAALNRVDNLCATTSRQLASSGSHVDPCSQGRVGLGGSRLDVSIHREAPGPPDRALGGLQ
jgi:hypothetical protein